MKTNTIQNNLPVIFTTLGLLPFLVMGFYALPTADDFCNAVASKSETVFSGLSHVYTTWSGRYTPSIMRKCASLVTDTPQLYAIMPTIWIVFLIHAIYSFLKRIIACKEAILFSLVISTVFFAFAPDLGQTLYWFTGARVYLLGVILLLYYISLLFKLVNRKYFYNKSIHLILQSVILILTIGCSEVIAIITVVIHLILFLHKQHRKQTVAFTSISIFFMLVSFLAPGNFERTGLIDKPDMSYLFVQSIFDTFFFWSKWIFQPYTILLFAVAFLYTSVRDIKFLFKTHWSIIILISFIIIYAGVAPSYFGVGGLGSYRKINPSYFFFILWITLLGIQAGAETKKRFNMKPVLYPFIIGIISASTLVFSKNSKSITDEFQAGTLETFKTKNEQLIQNYVQNNTLQYPYIKKPYVFKYYIPINSAETWATDCVKDFYESNE